ncbi:unnamed protein product [Ranitomeya imitator]|uniref:Uncharacterized protein n=1 Tax=Ranitomeya imitator TaxID=111125 RepID=A0ABN9LHA2_9NEOB|nr:unnamed protein product [Ranitomeya imitator]
MKVSCDSGAPGSLGRAWKQMSWLYYQYLLVTALYMLEPWERTIFSILISMQEGWGTTGGSTAAGRVCSRADTGRVLSQVTRGQQGPVRRTAGRKRWYLHTDFEGPRQEVLPNILEN